MEITAINNSIVKETVKLQQKKYRSESCKFLLEGYKSVKEAFDFGIEIETVFVSEEKYAKYDFIKDRVIKTNNAVLKKISTTDSTPEVVAVARQPKPDFNNLKKSKKVILLDRISDPGNLGTIIRTSAALNIDSIILYGDSTDLYNPKCVRSAVGNLWKVGIYHIKEINTLDKYFKDFERVATLPKNKNSIMLKDWTPKEKTLVMFGSEADGLSKELINYSTECLTIEMNPKVESLNLAISTGIVIYKMMN